MKHVDINVAIVDFGDIILSPEHKLRDMLATGLDGLTQVPIFSLLSQASDFLGQWQNRKFAERIFRFMTGCAKISEEDRFIFFSNLEECEEKRISASEIIMNIISKLDADWKVDVIINLMEANVQGFISSPMFYRLSYAIQNLTRSDVSILHKHRKASYIGGATDMLFSAGLLVEAQSYDLPPSKYSLNGNGKSLLAHGLRATN